MANSKSRPAGAVAQLASATALVDQMPVAPPPAASPGPPRRRPVTRNRELNKGRFRKVTMNFFGETLDEVEEVAQRSGLTLTEVFRQAVGLWLTVKRSDDPHPTVRIVENGVEKTYLLPF